MPEEKKALRANTGEEHADDYLASINYADEELGKFIDSLKSEGLMENTIIFIYGDHTIRMNYFFDKIQSFYGSTKSLNFPELHLLDSKTPLIIYSPMHLAHEQKALVAGQIDLAPTVLDMCGIKSPDIFLGNSVFSARHPDAVINYVGLGIAQNVLGTSYLHKERRFADGRKIENWQSTTVPENLNSLAYQFWLSKKILAADPAKLIKKTDTGTN